MTAGGFGPSTGRIVEANETHEVNLKTKYSPAPPSVTAFAYIAAVLCFIFGSVMIYEGDSLIGAALMAATAVLIVVPTYAALAKREA